VVCAAREEAESARGRTLERAARDARTEAERIRATARLDARDRALAEKGALVERVLASARDALAAMPDDAYADLLARRIAAAARGGERILVAARDVPRLAERLPAAIARAGGRDLHLVWSSEVAQIEHGVVLAGDRVRYDLSIDAVIQERRDELAMRAAEVLFGEEGV
jgi:vacuolar-type H+-ATPase subunit E/Vma4